MPLPGNHCHQILPHLSSKRIQNEEFTYIRNLKKDTSEREMIESSPNKLSLKELESKTEKF